MKACLVLLLAVAANAQYFGFNYPYATTYNSYGYGTAFPYSYNNIYHSLGKREAEAEPAHFYSAMPYYQHTPYAAAYKPITYAAAYKPVSYYKPMHMQAKTYSNDAMKPMGYAGKGLYHAESAGAVHIAKREAEAEPAHFYSAMPYYQHTPYAAAYKPITYAAAYKPVSYFKPMHMQAKTYSNDAMKPMGYAGKGMYHAESAGAVHIAKREAEADPALIYNSGVHYPMTYGLHNYGYTHYPYTTAYSHIFKREAEAEAEPQYYGNFYGNHAFTYGAYPYTYSGYNYPSYYY